VHATIGSGGDRHVRARVIGPELGR
jgi:hypothetical protein